METDEGKIGFSIELDDDKLHQQIDASKEEFSRLADSVEAEGERMDSVFEGLSKAVASLGLAWSVQEFGKQVATVRGEFQKLEVAMETMLQSKQKAEALMAQMVQTAATTPFGLTEVANGAKQLLAYGLEAENVNNTLIRLGDIAAGLSIPLGDLVYLYGTTMAQGRLYTQDFNQFTGRGIPMIKELAKQFGVAESKVKDLVEEGKVGFPEVQKVIESLTDEGGTFGGLMEKQSATITGQIANIEDGFDMMFNEIGQASEGYINSALSGVSYLVEHYQTVAEALGTLIVSYGAYKATLMAVTAYTNAAYSYEITQLKAVLAAKTSNVDADLAEAVSKGRVTAARAAEVQALRQELAAKIETAQADAVVAQNEANAATRKRMLAQLAVQKAQTEIAANQEAIFAMEGYAAQETVNTLYKEKDVLVTKLHTAQEELNAAAKVENAAKTKAATTAQNVATLTTQRDTIAKKLNTTQTTILTIATNGLKKAWDDLKLAVATNPLGAILMVATLIAGAFMTANDAISSTAQTTERFGEAANKQLQNMETLQAVINNTSAESKVHEDAVDELCKIYEDYGIHIDTEIDKLQQLNDKRDEVIAKIKEEGEERRKANEIQSYQDAIESSTQKMKDELLSALQNAEWEGSGMFDDWDADEYKERAEELATIIGSIMESESNELAKLSGDAYEERLQQINEKIKKAYQDLGLDITKEFMIEGQSFNLGTDVNEIGILDDYIDRIRGIVQHREDLINSYQESEQAANDEAEAVDYTTMKFDELFKTATTAEDKIAEIGRTKVRPSVFTDGLDLAITKAGTLLNQFNTITGTQWTVPQFKMPNFNLGLNVNSPTLGFDTNFDFGFSYWSMWGATPSAQQQAESEIEKRMAEAKKTRKGTADLLKEVNASLETAIAGSDEEKKLLGLQKQLTAQQKKFNAAEGKGKGNKKTGETAAERAAKEEKAQLELQKTINESAKARLAAQNDLELEIEQNEINLLSDAYEKKSRQLELDHKKEQQQLDEQKENAIKQEINRQKQIFDARENANAAKTKNYAKKNFKESDVDQGEIDKIKEKYEILSNQLVQQQERENADLVRVSTEGMRDYLKNYGTFQEQKLAIAQEYADKIAEVEKSDASSEEKAWKIKSLQQEQKKATDAVDANAVMARIDWYQVFGNVGNLMTGALRPLLADLKKFTQTDKFRSLDATQQKAIVEAMGNIRDQIGDNSDVGWKELAADITAYQAALREAQTATQEYEAKEAELMPKITAAQNKLKQAQQGTDVNVIRAAQTELDNLTTQLTESGAKVTSANDKVQTSGTKLAQTTQNVMQPIDEIHNFLSTVGLSDLQTLWDSFNQIKGAIDGLKALDEVKKAAEGVGEAAADAAGDVADAAGDVADSLSDGLSKTGLIGQIIAAVLKILDVLKDGIGTLVASLLDSILGAIEGIIDNILSGKFISQIVGSIIKGVGGIIDTVVGAIGSVVSFGLLSSDGPSSWFTNSNAAEVAETTERLTEENERLRESVDNLKDEMSNQGGAKAMTTYSEAVKNQQREIDNQLNILKSQMSYHSAHHSNAYYWGLGSGDYATLNSLLTEYAQKNPNDKKATQTSVYSLEDIYKLTPEQMNYIRTYNVDMWNKMLDQGKYDKSEYWDAYADLAGEMDEITDAFKESLTQVSFDSLRSSFLDELMDMDADAQDFSENFQEYLMESVLNAKISDLLEDEMQAYYDEWAKRAEDGLTDEDIAYLQNMWDQLVDKGLAIREEAASITGYTGDSSSSQDSTKKGFATASQDSIDELNGRFTAIQIDTSVMRETLAGMAESVASQSVSSLAIKQNTDEIRNLALTAIDYLQTLVKSNNELFEINERLGKIEKNTRAL